MNDPSPATARHRTALLARQHRRHAQRPEGAQDARAGLPTGPAKVVMVRAMFDAIAPRYDLVNRLMTFGLDVLWRRRAVRSLAVAPGSVVLDVACGTGDFGRLLAARRMQPVGIDLSAGMLAAGRGGMPVVQGDGAALPFADGAFEAATCGFALRNFADLRGVLEELGRVVRPGGRIALLDVAEPTSPLLRVGHGLWFRRGAPLIGALLSDASAYRYLPRSVAYLPGEHQLRALVAAAGFSGVNRHLLGAGAVQLITATRSGSPAPGTGAPATGSQTDTGPRPEHGAPATGSRTQ